MKLSPRPIILFIDEAHTMIGAGGQHEDRVAELTKERADAEAAQ